MCFDSAKKIYCSLVPKKKSIFRKSGSDSNDIADGECTDYPATNVTGGFAFENKELYVAVWIPWSANNATS